DFEGGFVIDAELWALDPHCLTGLDNREQPLLGSRLALALIEDDADRLDHPGRVRAQLTQPEAFKEEIDRKPAPVLSRGARLGRASDIPDQIRRLPGGETRPPRPSICEIKRSLELGDLDRFPEGVVPGPPGIVAGPIAQRGNKVATVV